MLDVNRIQGNWSMIVDLLEEIAYEENISSAIVMLLLIKQEP